jgi:hypothetical protein
METAKNIIVLIIFSVLAFGILAVYAVPIYRGWQVGGPPVQGNESPNEGSQTSATSP